MKRIIVVCAILGSMISAGFALESGLLPYGVGAKYAGMGGAAAAIVDDISSAYFNPAGIVKSGRVELKLGAGAATEGLADIMKVFGNVSDPTKFIADNVSNTINVNGNMNALIGLNIAKIGLTVIPVGSLAFVKPAGFNGNAVAMMAYEGILTLGYGLSTPILPVATLDLGANIKYVGAAAATVAANLNASTNSVTNYSGTGFDLGAKAKIDTFAIPFSVAVVIKDLGETLSGTTKATTSTYDPATGTTTTSPATETNTSITAPQTIVIGASTTIPGIGLKVAADIDSVGSTSYQSAYTVTHLGVEYPLAVLALRAGLITGGTNGSISMTTIGAGLNFFGNLNIAMIMDGKNTKNNQMVFDTGFAF
ncbi:hypothetical protein A3K48_04925 [candidate division WOR-1 bacterium RIFOXYA12_FULL_52_29]|uniref:DUF5723 domain-containing protein n=1 Tax=candidate division WOR-1 bacterium RIFOXYC12_FULL_54_18 TaxID=1802584 RepID=A0A1F4T6V5_UNCSA|nr:MAG: hypothetical protein A3K44_04925 [candidate division WOR-1 bacterium RIFOXYA2_FULL_51_19]OGC17890.1 MAG: hypothetical protein A3K48_04925 [candidate division WOR-1 bacterium RIFOXYA12_FULL_52_29]OGC26746.1 MAG: hypothetical protein A3K32_04920 [candidate division WOR-1 bacterium RIFOXYB2_FULL_45_9]OGC28307.1 MAG: hypothetical protein A3K49_04925 [candidate division WOR-1 bacterium RIFOXYC12_FULL_54_18]OGC31237.1 MAG: hypothetical protein A2346_07695 [candidate division WOR-1 bacterium R